MVDLPSRQINISLLPAPPTYLVAFDLPVDRAHKEAEAHCWVRLKSQARNRQVSGN